MKLICTACGHDYMTGKMHRDLGPISQDWLDTVTRLIGQTGGLGNFWCVSKLQVGYLRMVRDEPSFLNQPRIYGKELKLPKSISFTGVAWDGRSGI